MLATTCSPGSSRSCRRYASRPWGYMRAHIASPIERGAMGKSSARDGADIAAGKRSARDVPPQEAQAARASTRRRPSTASGAQADACATTGIGSYEPSWASEGGQLPRSDGYCMTGQQQWATPTIGRVMRCMPRWLRWLWTVTDDRRRVVCKRGGIGCPIRHVSLDAETESTLVGVLGPADALRMRVTTTKIQREWGPPHAS